MVHHSSVVKGGSTKRYVTTVLIRDHATVGSASVALKTKHKSL
jgi:hypothetical protein